jgi:hypothetical protein
MLKKVVLFFLIILFSFPLLCAQGLTELDKREILVRLAELSSVRQELRIQQAYVVKLEELSTQKAELDARALALEQKATQIAIQERDMWKDQAKFYKASLEAIRKKSGGIKCILKKIFTLGIARCGG